MPVSSKLPAFMVCIRNDGFAASLETRKIYQAIPDAAAAKSGMVRVVDESGDDYLYPAEWFAPIPVTGALRSALQLAS